ncbi:TdeIII family type II restriction endonuclease [Agarilytica rhodophyticola]|uniref:TdeIII family type II restriction endonuclease n=1 Tax=Agarilytica rhodophyticola TaxID=1737490 RepID=UPI001FEBA219|nr:TdeIII family type II restriction endonuclease [Agarilytica rhodophyticola]
MEIANNIKDILRACVAGALKRTENRIVTEKANKPFHKALLTPEIVKVSSFERSFSTSFGQGPIEKISELVAIENGFQAQRQKETMINVYKGAVDEVERICADLRSGQKRPQWHKEVQTLSSFTKGDTVVRRIISDLWLKKDATEYFISIKTVTPNLDQSEIAKKDMLLLKSEDSNFQTYLGLYYNPHGQERKDYNHSFPLKMFDMHTDECVLIGKDYWDFLGGIGAYERLLDIFAQVGVETRETLLGYQ